MSIEETKQFDIFNTLNNINVGNKTKEKNNLTYLPWAAAWEAVKRIYPQATFEVHHQIMDEFGNKRFWHDDGKTGWVEVSVTIGGITYTEELPIMDYRNQAITADKITSTDANKAFKRCLVKCLALHGLATYIYLGEDIPESESKVIDLKEEIKGLVNKKVKLSDKVKDKVAELCKAAEKEANPDLDDDLISGNYNNIEDATILENLKIKLLAVRKER